MAHQQLYKYESIISRERSIKVPEPAAVNAVGRGSRQLVYKLAQCTFEKKNHIVEDNKGGVCRLTQARETLFKVSHTAAPALRFWSLNNAQLTLLNAESRR